MLDTEPKVSITFTIRADQAVFFRRTKTLTHRSMSNILEQLLDTLDLETIYKEELEKHPTVVAQTVATTTKANITNGC